MTVRERELRRLIEQQRRDRETDGMGREWSKHKTYSVGMHYIRAPPKPLQSTRRAIYVHEKEGTLARLIRQQKRDQEAVVHR